MIIKTFWSTWSAWFLTDSRTRTSGTIGSFLMVLKTVSFFFSFSFSLALPVFVRSWIFCFKRFALMKNSSRSFVNYLPCVASDHQQRGTSFGSWRQCTNKVSRLKQMSNVANLLSLIDSLRCWLTRVDSFVIEQIGRSSKAFITVRAFVVSFTRVNPSVNYKRIFSSERFGTLQ